MKAIQTLIAIYLCTLAEGKLAGEKREEYVGKFMVGTPLFIPSNVSYGFGKSFSSRVHEMTETESHHDDEDDNERGRRREKRSTSLSSSEIQGILDRHNLLRGQVSPEASNMEYMIWDDDLATMAQQWSDECLWEHGNPDNISPFSSVGQNLWIGTAIDDGVGATQAWYNEVQYYDYDTHGCSDVCGHYTQVVWATSYAVGCGRTFCSSVSNGWNNAYIITCNYGPAGNYAGTRPYTTGSSCTQCASGVSECYQNQCRLCSDHSETCDCRAVCENCGTVNNDCTCTCRDGFHGTDCSSICENTDERCGANPGWPVSWCTEDYQFVLTRCPLMCGLCNEADPNEVCDPSAMTTSGPADVSTTSGPGGMSTTKGNSNLQTTTTTTTTTTTQACDVTCQNGGTLDEESCECTCPSEYQGDECEQEKSQVQYGVMVVIYTSINRWPDLRDILLRIIGEIVTTWCNTNFNICCPNVGTKESSSQLDYVDETHVSVANGFPTEETGLGFDAFRVMLLVSPPETTELCSSGSEYNSASRRKRWVKDGAEDHRVKMRVKRAEDTSGYLDQDALYEAVRDNVGLIEQELNVTVGEVAKGEVEQEPSSGGLAGWVVALIIIFVLLLIILVVLGVVYVLVLKGKKDRSVSPDVNKEKDAEPTSSPTS